MPHMVGLSGREPLTHERVRVHGAPTGERDEVVHRTAWAASSTGPDRDQTIVLRDPFK